MPGWAVARQRALVVDATQAAGPVDVRPALPNFPQPAHAEDSTSPAQKLAEDLASLAASLAIQG